MNRDVENPEMDENLNEIMKTKLNLEVKEEVSEGFTIALKGPLLTEKHVEDLKKSMKNNFEEMMKEIKESKKLTQENIEDMKNFIKKDYEGMKQEIEELKKLNEKNIEGMKKDMEFLMKENAQLKKKAASSLKKFNEESYVYPRLHGYS